MAAALLALPAGTYRLDPSHATLVFSVDHLGFSDFTATFDRFDAVLDSDPAMGVGDPVRFAIEAELTGPTWESNLVQEE